MTIDRINPYLIYQCITGSHAYGTNDEHSDVDIRGIFKLPNSHFLNLNSPPEQVNDTDSDTTYYELKKFFKLAADCNPNIIELLWIPEQHIQFCNDEMKEIIQNRSLFISKKACHTFSGYAYAQIKRAKGRNKWVHNPKPKRKPVKEQFCWYIPRIDFLVSSCLPARPVPVYGSDLNLDNCHVAKVEHSQNLYRLYDYGSHAKGVFRNQNLVTESIPISEEKEKFIGYLIYNQTQYEREISEHKNYWEWHQNRNEKRWINQEKGIIDYDAKNMMHCFRLLLSGKNIAKYHEPIIKFSDDDLQFLLDIKAGKFEYDYLIAKSEELIADLRIVFDESDIPKKVNYNKINELYQKIQG